MFFDDLKKNDSKIADTQSIVELKTAKRLFTLTVGKSGPI